ncbi:P-type conjugative transfer protein TrbJ [Actimicrobium sp. CCC2.4]|uniref:P-type conjugative transfer protein TrbJ n=1 Tax=Actimicrobium sp. CCC2.4 TaxID=3048606 RepID=UPI002AC931A7|nr:P-type conjugative transfer protein TrbJ [Actimicrobium sp. CCC2.4]MEB0134565.1 P-type conjugative transfer protein TrbJ [Actimicrobium sp. CCC2.4]WPX34007.1 P-type conjugative transfer protein TrbJ [Actimicrobium sp. CCC2.4]
MRKTKVVSTLALVFAIAGGVSISAHAGIPVIDGGNLTQNIMSAQESVAQTLKQILQYETQLQQYQNMLQNTTAPASYVWDQAQATINELLSATNTLKYYENQLGSLDAYIGKFQDVNYYQASPCFTGQSCSAADMAALANNQQLASQSQKKANDAIFHGLKLQQTNLKNDAAILSNLQSSAQGASGQLQAIGYANQLASQQANQLLQIRSLLVAQQNAVATKMQADADKDAHQTAAHTTSSQDRIGKTGNATNWLNLTR